MEVMRCLAFERMKNKKKQVLKSLIKTVHTTSYLMVQ